MPVELPTQTDTAAASTSTESHNVGRDVSVVSDQSDRLNHS